MNTYQGIVPAEVKELRNFAKISLVVFVLFQIGGIYLLVSQAQTYIDQITSLIGTTDVTALENVASAIPEVRLTAFQSFLSGMTISMTSGFWLTICLASLKINRPYKHRVYSTILWSFYLQVIFFLLSFHSVFADQKAIFNPGTIGSALTFVFTTPVFLKARKRDVATWSQEYMPPPPVL